MSDEKKIDEKIASLLNKKGKDKILIIILIGVLLMVAAMPTKKTADSYSSSLTGINSINDSKTSDYSEKLEDILSNVEGVGKVKALVKTDEDENVLGVMVVCEGGGDRIIVNNITEAVNSLLGVPAHRIKVMKMSNN